MQAVLCSAGSRSVVLSQRYKNWRLPNHLEMVIDKRRGKVKLTGSFSKVKVEFRAVIALHKSRIQFSFQK